MDRKTRELVKKVRAKSLVRARLLELTVEFNKDMADKDLTVAKMRAKINEMRPGDKPIAGSTLRRFSQFGRGEGYMVYWRGPSSYTLLSVMMALDYDIRKKSNK